MGRARVNRGVAAVAALALAAGCAGGKGGSTSSAATVPEAECGQAAVHADPARQVRAMWIATVGNGDWPNRPGLPASKQQAQYRHLLDVAKKLNFNTVYVQIRPTADAFYPSPYEPWSQYLTGHQGGDPGYDPLRFLVEEAHKRGLAFHAWFNPYRVSTQTDLRKLAANNPARRHPDWVRRYGNALWYDPGLPQVRALIGQVVLDVVRKYDIDGVHLDDYFYPYPLPGRAFPDKATYKKYGAGYKSVADWRRHNVDQLVEGLHTQIHQAKGWVEFGISPFGVWRNRSTDKAGSDTAALQSYDDIFADSRGWVKKGWLDYVAPQLYWPIGFKAADYRALTAWWSKQVAGTHVRLVIGQAAYQVAIGPGWNDPAELSRHLTLDATHPEITGDAFFSAHDLVQDRKGFATRLRRDHYGRPAIPPAAAGSPPSAPGHLTVKGDKLSWKGTGATSYAIYRTPAGGPACISPDGRLLLKIVGGTVHDTKDPAAKSGRYTYYVTALDRAHRESATSHGVHG